MKPFDLEKALAGEFIKVIGTTDKKRLVGKSAFRDNVYIVESEYGACTRKLETLQKGFEMWQAPRPRVQLDLPAPLLKVENGQEVFWINGWKIAYDQFNSNKLKMLDLLEAGQLFATKEDAQEWLNAMRNARR